MITYGYSLQGKSHIDRNTVCQDSSAAVKLKSGYYLGVVADGVGSAPHSDVGSGIAVESLQAYCEQYVKKGMKDVELEDILRDGYEYAFRQVEKFVTQQGGSIADYDTTLSSVLYDGTKVVFGHAGDGGIIVRKKDGTITPITERQKGADGTSVRPLRAGNSSWDFGICNDETASVLLVTDGMLDGVFQPVLVNLPSSAMELAKGTFAKNNVYVTACEFFMNPNMVYLNPHVKNHEAYMQHVLKGNLEKKDQDDFLKCMIYGYTKTLGKEEACRLCEAIKKFYFAVWAVTKVTDDKSVVCLMNEKAKVTPKEQKYYQEPNWKWRQECYQALLYGKELPPAPSDDPLYTGEKTTVQKPLRKVPEREMVEPPIHTPPQRVPPKKSRKVRYLVMTVSAAMICLVVGLIVGVSLGNRAGSKDNGTDVVMESPSPSDSKEDTGTSSAKNETSDAQEKKKINVVTQAEDFWDSLESVDSDEMSLKQVEELTDKVEKFKVFDMIAAIEGFSGSSNNSGTSYGTNGAKPTNTPADKTSAKNQNGIVKGSKLDDALQILKKMDELNVKQKNVFERELLWKYCYTKKYNAKSTGFGKLKGVLETVLDNDN